VVNEVRKKKKQKKKIHPPVLRKEQLRTRNVGVVGENNTENTPTLEGVYDSISRRVRIGRVIIEKEKQKST